MTPAFWKQLWLTLGASLAFLTIGLIRGYTASAIPSIEDVDPELIQNSEQKSWIGATPSLAAVSGSILSGTLMQRIGRKRALQVTTPISVVAWLILGFARNYPMLLVGRILTGVGGGFLMATSQVYVSECCDPEIRGRFGSLPTLSMSLGIVLSYVAGNWLYWRYLALFSSTFCVLLFLALLPLPESPAWLKSKGLDASDSIKWLHLSARATATVKEYNNEKAYKVDEPPSLFTREVFFSPMVVKPMIIGFALLLFQQYSGIDAVIFFTVEIFRNAGSTLDAMTATIIVGVVQLVSNGVSTLLVDRAGRRPLLLISAAIMCASMAAMGAAFYFQLKDSPWLGYLPIASLVVFMLGFPLGFGGLPFLLLGELFPAHYRSQLSAMASTINLLSMFSVIKSYHALDAALTSAGTFWMYSCFCAFAFFFVLFMVPETKGKSLAEIEQFFRSNKSELEKLENVSMQTVL
ncbi:facilitated trehalose transporter Tret1-like [Anticarsia gemmatalis]|uniref:facilitated trehalose transporter Tret1-like n=1 Tax=Anticarsia gemmatalis TaxID=129554 RepID=UPI003F75C597